MTAGTTATASMPEVTTPPLDSGVTAALAGRRIVVVGDIILDRYVLGRVERISPEAPVPVLRVLREQEMLGGAGNVVRNLVALGARPNLIGVVGEDYDADVVRRLLSEIGVSAAGLVTDPQRRTTVKARSIATGGHPILRTDWEDDQPLPPQQDAALRGVAREALRGADALLLSDYGKGVLARDNPVLLLNEARQLGLPSVVDPKRTDWAAYAGATVVTPNRAELRAAAGLHRDVDVPSMLSAAEALRDRYALQAVLLTRSEEGMTLLDGGAHPLNILARAREIADVSGAGDTVAAVLAAGLAGRLPVSVAAMLANFAAGIVVGRLGAATATAVEIEAEIDAALRGGLALRGSVLLAREVLLGRIAAWRTDGARIALAFGHFTPLRPEQARILVEARRRCERLVVALPGDGACDEALAILETLHLVDAIVICRPELEAIELLLREVVPDLVLDEAGLALPHSAALITEGANAMP